MSENNADTFEIKFPGDLDYIPAIRKYVSELLVANNFTPKFAYRSEIIVDELCNNAVTYGCVSLDASVQLVCEVRGDRIEFVVRDQGGRKEDIQKLNVAVRTTPKRGKPPEMAKVDAKGSLGLELVRMLSDQLNFEVDKGNLTSVRVVKLREDNIEQPTAK
jgi:anti-sigma regulatory factor (Ser/Thr protein kinase)